MKCLAKKSNGFEESCLELQWNGEASSSAAVEQHNCAKERRRGAGHCKGKTWLGYDQQRIGVAPYRYAVNRNARERLRIAARTAAEAKPGRAMTGGAMAKRGSASIRNGSAWSGLA